MLFFSLYIADGTALSPNESDGLLITSPYIVHCRRREPPSKLLAL